MQYEKLTEGRWTPNDGYSSYYTLDQVSKQKGLKEQ